MTTTREPFPPHIRTQADLEQVWRHLMGSWGFSRASVWLILIDVDDRPFPQIVEVVELDEPPEGDEAAGFAEFVAEMLARYCPSGRCALLYSRPGGSAVTAADIAWGRALTDTCRAHGVPADIVHLATDDDVLPLPYDVLARPA